jgi:hypothetical protein
MRYTGPASVVATGEARPADVPAPSGSIAAETKIGPSA